jgi:hypothetical protein
MLLTPEENERALSAALRAALAGSSLIREMRAFRRVSVEELAARTGMPVARFKAEEERRLSFTDVELDAIAAALNVPVDLLLD